MALPSAQQAPLESPETVRLRNEIYSQTYSRESRPGRIIRLTEYAIKFVSARFSYHVNMSYGYN